MNDCPIRDAFRLADTLTFEVYNATDRFPRRAGTMLAERMRKNAASVATSVIEGCASGDSIRADVWWHAALRELRQLGDDLELASSLEFLCQLSYRQLQNAHSEMQLQVLSLLAEGIPGRHALAQAA